MNEEDILEEINYLKKKTVLLEKLITQQTHNTSAKSAIHVYKPTHDVNHKSQSSESFRNTRSIC
jgi:kynureninase